MFTKLIIIICILFNFINIINAKSCKISQDEYNALQKFYIATNGSHWYNNNSKWVFPSDLNEQCETKSMLWYGLKCIEINFGLCSIQNILLSNNNLQGNIIKDIDIFYNLTQIHLNNNLLSGCLPSELGNLPNLVSLNLTDNQLSGSLPTELGNLLSLLNLEFGNNQLSGSIPSELGNLNYLRYLNLEENQLSGSIPSELGNLHRILNLNLDVNQLSGSLPSELGNLIILVDFHMNNNQINGSIPSELGNLNNLRYIYLNDNQLSGYIPTELGNITFLGDIYLYNNKINGSIPSELGNLNNLIFFFLFNNQLSGSIPSELGNLKNLIQFFVYNNQLSGSIPNEIGNLRRLNVLDFSNNTLSGSIPKSFNQLNNLKILFLTNNSLNGSLYDIFDSKNQSQLANIDFVNNKLSGSIPSNIFGISSLETFAISNNCIKGSIPKEICSSLTLNSIIFNGLSTKCGARIFPSYFSINTFVAPTDIIIGGIPTCVFNMINLTTLQVSSNSITGTLSKDIILSNTLTSIDLSTNLYSGKILNVIQKKQWRYLNLGFNKFKDTIIETFPISSKTTLNLTLVNNRISGLIPSSLNSYSNINILGGNIFSCSSIFPKNDPLSPVYQCGTKFFYQLILIFCFITIIIILMKLRFYKDDDNILQNVWYKNINRLRIIGKEIQILLFFRPSSLSFVNKHDVVDDSIIRITDGFSYEQDSNISLLLIVSENIQQCLIYIIVFNICIWLSSSTILHQYYSTYDFMYGYNLSMAFLSGYIPAILLILLIITSIIFIYYLINRICFESIIAFDDDNNSDDDKNDDDDDKNDKNIKKVEDDKKSKSHYFWIFLLVLIINLIAMIAINGFYVITSLNPQKYPQIKLIAILVSILKTVWKSIVLPLIISNLNIIHEEDGIESMYNTIKINTMFQCCLGILNIIFIPFFTTSLLSSNCIKYALIEQPYISSSYSYNDFLFQSNGTETTGHRKRENTLRTSSFKPPFIYSYQCTSTLMTIYDSVYIYTSILLILEPLLLPFVKVCYRKLQKYERIEKLMNKLLPSNLKPLQSSLTSKIKKDQEKGVEIIEKNSIKVILFHQTNYTVNIVIYMTLSVTVGFILPLVGIIICISLYLYIHSVLSNIGGKLANATINDKEILEKECKNFVDNLNINLNRYIYPIMGIFFSTFVFDIVGDKKDSDDAVWCFIITLLMPFILWLIRRLYYNIIYIIKSTQKIVEEEVGTEIQNIRKNELNNPLIK